MIQLPRRSGTPLDHADLRRWLATAAATSVLLLLSIAGGWGAVRADQGAREPCLYPMEPPGFIELQSFILHITIQCEGDACIVRSEQAYRVHNRDRIEPNTLRLTGAPSDVPWAQIELRDGSGNIVPKTAGAQVWQITLTPDERKTLLLSYQRTIEAPRFLTWRWNADLLAPWETIGALRVQLTLPTRIPADALYELEPYTPQFDGQQIIWDYEGVGQYPAHRVSMLSPATLTKRDSLRQQEQHRELGRLYLELYQAAEEEGVSLSDPFERAVAEFLAAIEHEPGSAEASLDLAALYRERSDQDGAAGLNYLLLSAEQLQNVLNGSPERSDVAERLAQTYREAALRAQQMGDTAGALRYLHRAQGVPGMAEDAAADSEADLTLQWALDMAEKGMVSEALVQMRDTLTPDMRDALLRYAPPISAVRTEVWVGPTSRQVSHLFTLYPPAADTTRLRLQRISEALGSVEGVQVTIADPVSSTSEVAVKVVANYATEQELGVVADTVQYTLASDRDLLTSLMALPWQEGTRAALRERTPWRETFRYHERVDLTPVVDAWAREARYAEWRLVELQGVAPQDDRERLKQHLALKALSEQQQVWRRLSSGSYWVFHLDWGQESREESRAWVLSWGQVRTLSVEIVRYRWPFLLRAMGLLLITVVVVAIAVRPGWRLGQRRAASGEPREV